jgi:hypothetical protein
MFYTVSVDDNYFNEWVMLVNSLEDVPSTLKKFGKELMENRTDGSLTLEEFEAYTVNIDKTVPYDDQDEFYALDGSSFWEVMDNQTHVMAIYNGEIKGWDKYNA